MAYIYKIVNDINEKVYIGKTYNSIQKRFSEHCHDCQRQEYKDRPLYRAMNKYGIEHFRVELVEETDTPEEREVYWIKYFNSYYSGYNATLGGEGTPKFNYDKILDMWENGFTQKEISEVIGCHPDTVAKVLKSNEISKEDRIKREQNFIKKAYGKQVAMMDMSSKEVLKIFPSIKEAERFLNLSYESHIAQVCNGKRKSANGYLWKYV